jgi:hypothetical protein
MNIKPLELQEFKPAAMKRYADMSQALYDALTPFVDAYEANAMKEDRFLPDKHPKYLAVTMGDLRRAQRAMRGMLE